MMQIFGDKPPQKPVVVAGACHIQDLQSWYHSPFGYRRDRQMVHIINPSVDMRNREMGEAGIGGEELDEKTKGG